MKLNKLLIIGLTLAPLLSSCASKAAKEQVDKEVAAEPAVPNRAALSQQTADLIQTTPGLTDDQRTRLMKIRDDAHNQMTGLNEESLKLRSLLVKDTLETPYNRAEVNQIKKRIAKLDKKREKVLFKAVDDANKVLGHEDQDRNSKIMMDIVEFPRSGRAI